MEQAFLDINGVPTSVAAYGKWVKDRPKSGSPEDIVLIIPGNPGLGSFYRMFQHTLHENLKWPVWCISHAGHDVPQGKAAPPLPSLKDNHHLYDLAGQIKHKVDFIDKYVPANARLHLIGHSIGCYIILELLKVESIRSKVADVKLLFPALENLAETKNGRKLLLIKRLVWILLFLSWIFTMLPNFLQTFLVYCYIKIRDIPKMHMKSLMHLVNPEILENAFYLGYVEMDQVKERNNQAIIDNLDKITFMYGADDEWAPKAHYDKLKSDIPQANIKVFNFKHVFVFKESREVANYINNY